MQFIVGWPRCRNPMKAMYKPHYASNYNWTMNPMYVMLPHAA